MITLINGWVLFGYEVKIGSLTYLACTWPPYVMPPKAAARAAQEGK